MAKYAIAKGLKTLEGLIMMLQLSKTRQLCQSSYTKLNPIDTSMNILFPPKRFQRGSKA
jgi:hypothetical protein